MDKTLLDLTARIAVLEHLHEASEANMERRLAGIEEFMREVKNQGAVTNAALSGLTNKISKYEGKFGGIVLAVTCVWVFIAGLPSMLSNWAKTWEIFK